ncbi:MAG TPA: hypothetical protein DFH97_08200 [Clostridiales bacterium]|nr:hypothetical protein [Clostridiales bacterium]
METKKTFDELMQDKDFIVKLNEAKSIEEAEKMCAEYGVDLNGELSDLPEGELSDNQLDAVAGGAVTWKTAKNAFKFGMQAGVVIRKLYDKKNGKPLTYPNWRFEW